MPSRLILRNRPLALRANPFPYIYMHIYRFCRCVCSLLVFAAPALSVCAESNAPAAESALSAPSLPETLALTTTFSPAQQLEGVRAAVKKALRGREWTITAESDGTVRAALTHRKFDATIAIVYTAQGMRFYSDSYAVKKDGKRIKDVPMGWLKNLEKDVLRELGLSTKR